MSCPAVHSHAIANTATHMNAPSIALTRFMFALLKHYNLVA